MSAASAPRISVVIPTFGRRDLVVDAVQALDRQHFDGDFEVIVVVDGSTDGTGEALEALAVPRLQVIEQPNAGAAAARNRGAGRARGEILLFLDDDMVADERMLAEHDRRHREGAEVVLGHMPLHPASRGFISRAVGEWSEQRLRELSAPGAPLGVHDLLTGQISIRAGLFRSLGGFDERFTAGGSFGDEDLDLGQRLLDGHHALVFEPAAVSRQRYVVTPRQHLRQWRQTGRADVAFARKHPARAADLFAAHGAAGRRRTLWRAIAGMPGLGALLSGLLRPAVLAAARARPEMRLMRAFAFVRSIEYWRGVREAGGMPRPRAATVLAYHGIRDDADVVVGSYSVAPAMFARHLATLHRLGFHPVSAAELVAAVTRGAGLPRRPLLITFDDCYDDLAGEALPLLERWRAPALAFAVSGLLGDVNRWDVALGARPVALLGADGLRDLSRRGVAVGAHSRTHRELAGIAADQLAAEVGGSVDDLEAAGLPRPVTFAYPYGVHDAQVRAAVRDAGIAAAFTTRSGRARPGRDPLRLPRVEVRRADGPWRLVAKIARSRVPVALPSPVRLRRALRARIAR